MTVNQYQVELRVHNKRTGQDRVITRMEHAYDVSGAVSQAIYNSVTSLTSDETLSLVTHVGPPDELIRACSAEIAKSIEETMRRLKNSELTMENTTPDFNVPGPMPDKVPEKLPARVPDTMKRGG